MQDSLQRALQTLAYHNAVVGDAAIVCAAVLVYVMCVVWLIALAWRHAAFTLGAGLRIVALFVLAFAASRVLGHVISDPRPYIVEHVRPLIALSHDNGFPSDHTLLAAALTAGLYWFDRRLVPFFALGTLLVLLGRLGVAAHHTLDVAGSVVIVAIAALLIAIIPLPSASRQPLFPALWRVSAKVWRPIVHRDPMA